MSFDLLALRPGDLVLDVGCGTGDDARALAELVGAAGRVVGLDYSATMVAQAQQRAAGSGLPVEFQAGDARRMDFPTGAFGAVRANRVLVHLDEPEQVVREMARVAGSGARIVCFERDWDSLVIDAADLPFTRQIIKLISDSYPSGWVGRRLPALFRACGLEVEQIIPDTIVLNDFGFFAQAMELREAVAQAVEKQVVSQPSASAWLQEQEDRGQAGNFFAAATGFIVSGRKP